MERQYQQTPSTTAWAALTIAFIALMVSFIALNQASKISPQNRPNNLQREINALERQAQLNQARLSLEDTRNKAVNNEIAANAGDVQKQLAQIRDNLRTELSSQKSWRDIDSQLEAVEKDLRAGSITVLDAIERALTALRQEIKIDEQ
jgi:hypothetical protein